MIIAILKRLLPLIAASAILCLTACISEDEDFGNSKELQIGDSIPGFIIEMNNGEIITTQDLKGRCAVIAFFHTGCPDCQAELPILQKLQDECDLDFQLICISRAETSASILDYWKTHHLSLPFSAQPDCALFERFAASRIPRIYISDKQLKILATFADNPIATYEQLLQAIARANTTTPEGE